MTTVGRSVIVSAAAGAGKTAVLARRCAYLVCDAPPADRCDVRELLVLTFTDASASEMRERIVKAIRARQSDRPQDSRLRQQVALADVAQISTIHSFCSWLLRRWFNEIGVDPTATLLDGDEASLLAEEVLEELFAELYASDQNMTDPLGAGTLSSAPRVRDEAHDLDLCKWNLAARSVGELGSAFVRLVDDYGLGDDREIRRLVMNLSSFLASLPDPQRWLNRTVLHYAASPGQIVEPIVRAMVFELKRQIGHCETLVSALTRGDSIGHAYAGQIQNYVELLADWHKRLSADGAQFEEVRREICETDLPRAVPLRKKDLDEKRLRIGEYAQHCFAKQVKERLFRSNLRDRFSLFSQEEWVEGMRRVGPYVASLADITMMFRTRYAAEKRRLHLLDFADLERLAFELLYEGEGSKRGSGEFLPSAIAGVLHRRFRYVLVDEFQDINPIQEAILKLVSHESEASLPGNLFSVGDVKQSIYRFRLAEPGIFTRRLHRATAGPNSEKIKAIFLQENFRSRSEILDAVNFVFRRIMRPGSGRIAYDEKATLCPGRGPEDAPTDRIPVEVHVLERTIGGGGDDETDRDNGESPFAVATARHTDSSRWSKIEREAYCIGQRIERLMRESAANDVPLGYRDVVILLRSTKVNADLIANVLGAMGIPAFADAGGSLFSALEVRDVLSALRVLDNEQQDIPLAATLRGGLFGEVLTEDQFVKIRLLNRALPFHQAVRRYAETGEDADFRKQLGQTLATIHRYRSLARRKPLAEVIWKLYQERAYFARVCGLENGPQRRANLLKLHDIARRFSSFRTQGVHRFLRFIERLEERRGDFGVAPMIGESEEVVRIMTIHQSKGLEFPVVFVAGMGNRFNLQDEHGRMLFERQAGIGLRVVEPQRMIEYPSVSHLQARLETAQSSREEELRVLYVAMTRAKDRLILIGSWNHADRLTGDGAIPVMDHTAYSIGSATTYFDWVLPVLTGDESGAVVGLGRNVQVNAAATVFDVTVHDEDEIRGWTLARKTQPSREALLQSVARFGPLPETEPLVEDDSQVRRVLDRLDFDYPYFASTSVRAAVAASQFKGGFEDMLGGDERYADWVSRGDGDFSFPPSRYDPPQVTGAGERGTITHRVLQFLNFAVSADARGVEQELQRLVDVGKVSQAERETLAVESLVWFVSTPLAERIRRAGKAYRREFRFVTTEPAEFFDPEIGDSGGDRVLVRGIADGVLVGEKELELIDFKTDAIDPDGVVGRVGRYEPQMVIYARAISRLWGKPVRRASLVFLTPKKIVEILTSKEGDRHRMR